MLKGACELRRGDRTMSHTFITHAHRAQLRLIDAACTSIRAMHAKKPSPTLATARNATTSFGCSKLDLRQPRRRLICFKTLAATAYPDALAFSDITRQLLHTVTLFPKHRHDVFTLVSTRQWKVNPDVHSAETQT